MSILEQAQQVVPSGTWKVDPSHSTVEFAVKHMGFATVKGRFTGFDATLEGGDEPRLAGTIRIESVDTHDETRDGHLASPDFFDAERYPEARFEAAPFRAGRVVGQLTLKGVTRDVELEVSLTGAGADPWGNERLGVDLAGEIDRRQFGLTWNQPLPGGGVLVSDTVKLSASLSLVRGE